jgi:6-phosphogluconolactonase (cycloisomerase 2 family)
MNLAAQRSALALTIFAAVTLSACGGSSAPPTYKISGTVAGLPAGQQLTLLNSGASPVTVSANGAFEFADSQTAGAAYAVTVGTQPARASCTLVNANGTVSGANVTNIAVTCQPNFAVGGTISGLPADTTITLANGTDTVSGGNGAFTFRTRLIGGAAYTVSVDTQPATQRCTVSSGAGTIAAADVTTVAVSCVSHRSVGGTISGLVPKGSIDLKLNGGTAFTVDANGAFAAPQRLLNAETYALTIDKQPAGQTCTLGNGSGTIASADVTTVTIACATQNFYMVGANQTGNSLQRYDVNGTTGATAALGPLIVGNGPTFSMSRNEAGTFLAVPNLETAAPTPASVSIYSLNAATGDVTAAASSPTPTGGSTAWATKFSPDGKWLAVVNRDSNSISMFGVSATGVLTAVAGSPFSTGATATGSGPEPWQLAFNNTGSVLLVGNRAANSVSSFAVNPTTGALTPATGSPFSVGPQLYTIRVSPQGFLYVPSQTNDEIEVFTIGANGVLTKTSTATVGDGREPILFWPDDIVFNPSGTYAWVACFKRRSIVAFTVDKATGALAPIVDSEINAGVTSVPDPQEDAQRGPHTLAISPAGNLVFSNNNRANSISAFSVNPSGSLTALTGSPFATGDQPSTLVPMLPR